MGRRSLILFIIFLVCSLTPASAVSLSEAQKSLENITVSSKTSNNAFDHQSFSNMGVVAKLKFLKNVCSELKKANSDVKGELKTLKKEEKAFQKEKSVSKRQHRDLLAYRNSKVKDASNGDVNKDADHIVSELKTKNIVVTKKAVASSDLNAGVIVQTINKNGYIRYLVYGGTFEQDGVQMVELSAGDGTNFNLSVEEFKKEYTGISLIPYPDSPKTVEKGILQIQKEDLNAALKNPKTNGSNLKHRNASVIALVTGMIVGLCGGIPILLIKLSIMAAVSAWTFLGLIILAAIGIIIVVVSLICAIVYAAKCSHDYSESVNRVKGEITDLDNYIGNVGGTVLDVKSDVISCNSSVNSAVRCYKNV